MQQIVIRDLDQEAAVRLQQQAQAHNVSVDEEAKAILMRELATPSFDPVAFVEKVRRRRESQPLVTFDIAEAIREGRE